MCEFESGFEAFCVGFGFGFEFRPGKHESGFGIKAGFESGFGFRLVGFGFGFKEKGLDSDSDSWEKGWIRIRIRDARIRTSLVPIFYECM